MKSTGTMICCLVFAIGNAFGSTYYWTGDQDSYFHTGLAGPNTNWSTSATSNIDPGSLPGNFSADTLVFTCTGAINYSAANSNLSNGTWVDLGVGNLQFNRSGVGLIGAKILLGGNITATNTSGVNTIGQVLEFSPYSDPHTFSVATGGTLRVGRVRYGTLIKTGGGVLEMSDIRDDQSYKYNEVQDGILRTKVAEVFQGLSEVRVSGSGVLDCYGYDQKIGTLDMTGGTVETDGGLLSIINQGAKIVTHASSTTATINGLLKTWSYDAGLTIAQGTTGGSDLVINAVISGDDSNSGFIKTGAGMVKLAGVNTYQGRTTINAGTVHILADSGLGAAPASFDSDHLELNNGTLRTSGTFTLAANRGIYMRDASGTIYVEGSTSTVTVAGVIGGYGTGAFTKDGPGTLVLGAVNAYFFDTVVKQGTLKNGVNGALNSGFGVRVEEGATYDTGAFTQTLTKLTLFGGTAKTTGGALTVPLIETEASAITSLISGALTLSRASVIDTFATITTADGAASSDLKISAAISLGTGVSEIRKEGAGTLELSGTGSSYSLLTVNAGVVKLGASNVLPDAATIKLTAGTSLQCGAYNDTVGSLELTGASVAGSGTITVGGDVLVHASSISSTIGRVSVGAMERTFTVENGSAVTDLEIQSGISGTGSFRKAGLGLMALSAVCNYSGTVTVADGTLQLMVDSALPSSVPNALYVLSPGTLDVNGHNQGLPSVTMTGGTIATGSGTLTVYGTISSNAASGSATISGNLNMGIVEKTFTIADGAAADDMVVSAVLSAGAGLVKSGAGVLKLTGANIYDNRTTVADGVLSISAASALGANPSTLDTDRLKFTGGTLRTTATMSLTSTQGVWASSQAAFNVDGSTILTINGPIGGAGGLGMSGAGTLVLGGAGNYSGDITVSSGTLRLAAGNALPSTTRAYVLGTLDLNGFNQTVNELHVTGATVQTGAGKLTVTTTVYGESSSTTSTLSGSLGFGGGQAAFDIANGVGDVDVQVNASIMDATNLTKSGAGKLRLAASNTYSGATAVTGGTLEIGHNQALATGTNLNLAGGTLDTLGRSFTIGTLDLTGGTLASGTGTITLGGDVTTLASTTSSSITGNLSLGTTGRRFTVADGTAVYDLTVSASMTGTGGLTKAGSGYMMISANAGYSGTTTVESGKLYLGADNLLQGTVAVLHGGTLDLNGHQDTIDWLDLTGGANATSGTGGNLNLSQGVHVYYSASTASTSGALDILAAGTTFDIANAVPTTDFWVYSNVGGTGGLVKSGEGVMLLASTNTYSGGTTVNAGTLKLGGADALPSGRSVTITAATVDIVSYNQSISSLTMTGGQIVGSGGRAAFTSLTTLASSNTSTVSCALDVGASTRTITVANGAAATDLQLSGGISGQGGITISAAGATVLLGGTNTYEGTTRVITTTGQVLLGGSPALPAGGNVEVLGTFDTQGNNVLIGGLTLTGGTVRSGAGTTTVSSGVTCASSSTTSNIEGKLGLGSDACAFSVANGAAPTDLSVSAIVNGAGGLVKSGAGLMVLSGTSANTFTGQTVLDAGMLALNKSSGAAIVGDLVVNAGTLRFDAAGQLGANCDVSVNGGTIDLESYASTARSATLGGASSFSGSGGVLTANLLASSSSDLSVTGNVSLGNAASYSGFRTAGVISIAGGGTLAINAKAFATLGVETTLTSATLSAPNGIYVGGGCTLSGSGTVSGKISAGFGSTIEASGGNLNLGDANSYDGFYSDGTVLVGNRTVTLYDKNQAVLGSLTQMGGGSTGGAIVATNGLMLNQGKNLVGFGTVTGTAGFVADGFIHGEGPGPSDGITFNIPVSGYGTFSGNVTFNGGFSPGHSPAGVNLENVQFGSGNTLTMELGGTVQGSQYDQLTIAGSASLDGTLSVSLLNGYAPEAGSTFQLFDGATSGTFSQVALPTVPGMRWDTTTLYSNSTLGIYYNGDVTRDNLVNAADIDSEFANLNGAAWYDLSGDGMVNQTDVDELVKNILHTIYGDANLDLKVDFMDFQTLLDHWQQSASWATGDWNGDTACNFLDFQKLLDNWNPSGVGLSQVPEPATLSLLALGGLAMLRGRRMK